FSRDGVQTCALPISAGTKMVVSGASTWGSIGGGNMEITAVERARGMLAQRAEGPEVVEFGLTEHASTEHGRQCCGGQVRVLLEQIGRASCRESGWRA